MTKQEFDEMAALVVRLRKDVELHTDALKQSNTHCGKLPKDALLLNNLHPVWV